jgi:NAD-dependent deacetylase sirtuin 2
VYIFSDALERVAGIPAEKLVEAHGTLHTSRCINPECRKEYDRKWMTGKQNVMYFEGFISI